MKQEGGSRLMQAIRQVLDGGTYASEKISARILAWFSGWPAHDTSPVGESSDRELQVFQLLGEGLGTKQVAVRLHISPKTVEVHRVNIKQKMGLSTVPELIRAAVRWVESQNTR